MAKRKQRTDYKKAKDDLWDLVSIYIRTKYSVDGHVKCVTCGINKPIKSMQAGHFIPKAKGNSIYFVEENIHPQCYRCNINLGSNGPMYYRFMAETYGKEKVDELIALSNTAVKFKLWDLQDMMQEYQELYDNLEQVRA